MKYGCKFCYLNYTFMGVNKFNKKFNFEKVLKILHLPTTVQIDLKRYSYEDFYKSYENINPNIKKESRPDIFLCLEDNKMYIPGNDCIFEIKRLDKIKRMLME